MYGYVVFGKWKEIYGYFFWYFVYNYCFGVELFFFLVNVGWE